MTHVPCCDVQEKWGGENVFSVMTGGRSLRYTGG